MLKAEIDWFEGRLNRIYELEAARHYGMEAGCDAWVELKKLYTEMSAETPKLIAAARESAWLRSERDGYKRYLELAHAEQERVVRERNENIDQCIRLAAEVKELKHELSITEHSANERNKDLDKLVGELKAEVARLREALVRISTWLPNSPDPKESINNLQEIAHVALKDSNES